MFFRTVFASVLLVVATGLPAPVLALGGSNSGSSSGTPVPTAPQPTATPQIGDVPACTSSPAEGATTVCGCAAGTPSRMIWGNGPYTADSDICTAARHAGAIGQDGGVVRVTGLPGQANYSASTANGVESRAWGSFGQSFAVEGLTPVATSGSSGGPALAAPQCDVLPDGVDSLVCSCQANAYEASASVWGSDPYTADSALCAAAMHSGYMNPGEPADIYVLRVPGLESYLGSENNGVTSQDWGAYGSSFVFDWNR